MAESQPIHPETKPPLPGASPRSHERVGLPARSANGPDVFRPPGTGQRTETYPPALHHYSRGGLGPTVLAQEPAATLAAGERSFHQVPVPGGGPFWKSPFAPLPATPPTRYSRP